jgi:hypothetical protein
MYTIYFLVVFVGYLLAEAPALAPVALLPVLDATEAVPGAASFKSTLPIIPPVVPLLRFHILSGRTFQMMMDRSCFPTEIKNLQKRRH